MKGGTWRHRFVYALCCLTVLVAAVIAFAEGVEKSPPTASTHTQAADVRDLVPGESIPLSSPPPLILVGKTKCDLKGNIYIVQSGTPPALLGGGGISSIPVSKLSIDSKSPLSYSVPRIDRYRGVIRPDFDVSADGHVYSLLEALDASPTESEPPPSFFIAKYKDDGSLDSYFKLGDAPDRHLQPFRFAMFRDGNVLVSGTSVGRDGLRPFIAVLDSGGRFVTYVKATHDAEPKRPEKYETASDYAVTLSSNSFLLSAPDGNVYLLRGADGYRLYVISSAGQVTREFEVPQPAPGLSPTNMGTAGDDMVFIAFGRVQGGVPAVGADSEDSKSTVSDDSKKTDSNGPKTLISLLSPQTGKVSEVYRLPENGDPFDLPACATSADNFLFVGTTEDRQHQQVRRYVPR